MANTTRYPSSLGATPLTEAVDQLFREAFTWPRMLSTGQRNGTSVGLSSSLYETNDAYIMQVVLPGVTAEDLQISAQRNVLTLQGMIDVRVPENARGLWVGLPSGEFREQVALPGEVDGDQASAEYRDGILTLTLPKLAQARVKTIKVGGRSHPAIEGQKK